MPGEGRDIVIAQPTSRAQQMGRHLEVRGGP
jgi:hypothetical protein